MTALDLDALLALREQATGGEWTVRETSIEEEADVIATSDDGTVTSIVVQTDAADAAYMVALHNAAPELVAKAREADRLHQWKAEAIEVIEGWEAVWEALGRPGTPGQLKSAAVLAALSPSDGGDQ